MHKKKCIEFAREKQENVRNTYKMAQRSITYVT